MNVKSAMESKNMSVDYIKYRSGYKYQLDSDYDIIIKVKPENAIDIQFIKLGKPATDPDSVKQIKMALS